MADRQEYFRLYNIRNRKKISDRARQWRKENPERCQAHAKTAKIYYENNKRNWRKHREKWRINNPSKFNRAQRPVCARYRAKKRKSLHPTRDEGVIIALYNDASGLGLVVDHIIPLKHGGWHHEDNLQLMSRSLNAEKNASVLWEMDGYKSWRDVPEFLWPDRLRPMYERLK